MSGDTTHTLPKVLCIVGARPQFVKLAPLAQVLTQHCQLIIAHTGQHYDPKLSALLFDELEIPKPDYQLGIGSGSHGAQTGRMLEALEGVMMQEKPHAVVVFGDTNSTLAGSLAAAKLGIRSLHVEAGLRSWNRSMPEEINRVVSDHTCDVLLAPTQTAMRNLAAEGLAERSVLTGDIMVDALEDNARRALDRPSVCQALGINGPFWLLTLHRPYNVDDPARLQAILEGLDTLGRQFVFPVHPRTLAVLQGMNRSALKHVTFVDPQGYLEFLQLEHAAEGIMTDSGGVQKEAYLMERPCVTLRTETEWLETVEAGWNCLVPPLTPGWLERVRNFSPATSHPALFGSRVAESMRQVILDASR